MAKMVKQAHGGALKIPEKGDRFNPNGRPKTARQKFVVLAKELGVRVPKDEQNEAIERIMSMTVKEANEYAKNNELTIAELTVLKALQKGVEKGSLYNFDSLTDRVHGKAPETLETTHHFDLEEITRNLSEGAKVEVVDSFLNRN